MKTHVWKPIGFDADECTQCGTIARVGDNPLKDGQPCPGTPEALTVDLDRGSISMGSHRSFVAKPIARAVQKLIDTAKEGTMIIEYLRIDLEPSWLGREKVLNVQAIVDGTRLHTILPMRTNDFDAQAEEMFRRAFHIIKRMAEENERKRGPNLDRLETEEAITEAAKSAP